MQHSSLLIAVLMVGCCLQAGIDDGAVLLTGGRRPSSCPKGYFLEPTVFIKVQPQMRIWKEEIFGPVLSGRWGIMMPAAAAVEPVVQQQYNRWCSSNTL